MNDKDMHNNVDALLGHPSIEKPSVYVVKKSRRRFYNFILLLAACLSIGFCLVMPVWSDKTGLEIIQDWISSNDSSLTPLGDDPPLDNTSPAYDYWNAPPDSFGIQETKTVNWSYFKQLFNDHFYKNARYKRYSYSYWADGTQYLSLNKTWNDSGFWKVDIILDIPVDLYSVNVSFGCDLPVLNYIEREGHEIWLNYTANATETYQIKFNWSDIASIPNLEISKHRQDGKFWISFKRDNVPSGYYVFDPTFGETDAGLYDSSIENNIHGNWYMMGATGGDVDNISFYIKTKTSPDNKVKCAIYECTAGDNAGNLITNGVTDEIIVSTANTWYTASFSGTKPVLAANTKYYLFAWANSTAGFCELAFHLAGNNYTNDVETYNGFPSPFPDSTNDGNRNYSIYCSYTTSAANNAPTQSLQKIWNSATEAEKSLNATGVSLTPTCFNVTIADIDADQMNVTIKTNESGTWTVVNQTASGMSNGTYHGYNTSWVDSYNTKYWISFNVSDDSEWCNETYSFWTYNKTNQRLGDYWFLGGNVSSNNQLGNFWLLGNNVSNNNQLGDYWFQGGNISSNNQIANYWFLGGNVSSNNQLGNFWFLGGNVSVKSNQQLGDHWFLGGNTSNNNQLGDFWFLGGNTTARINEQLGNFWFLGGNETGNNQLGDFWFLGGNETTLLDIYDEYPSNESNVFGLQPTIRFSLTNPTGDPMNYTIYTGNSTANCTHYLDNISGVNNGTYHYVNYFNATNYTVDYYWRVYAEDGTQHVNKTFYFTPSMQGGQVISSQGVGISIAAAGMMIGVIALVFAISKRKKRSE